MKTLAPKFSARVRLSQVVARARQILAARAPEALSLLALLLASACDPHPQRHPATAPSPRTAKQATTPHGQHDWYWADSEDE